MIKLLQLGFFFVLISSFAQNNEEKFLITENINKFKIPDSLQNQTYKSLKTRFHKHSNSFEKANLYARSYIKKSLIAKDSIEMARGYFLLSSISHDSLIISYLDRAIDLSKNFHSKYYPALLYYSKGDYYFENANYKEALDNYFISYNMTKDNNPVLAYDSKFNIGSLKNRVGKYKEAQKIFKEYYDYILSEESKYPKDYYNELIALFALSDSYTRLKKLDTATTINQKGIKISLLNNDKDMYHYFIMNEGVNLYFKKKYKSSIDSLKKAIPNIIKLGDQSNIMFSRLYLGKAYYELNKVKEAVKQYKKVDSLFSDYKDFFPEIREGYKSLIDFYKNNGDKENQLFYLNRLIFVDSIYNINYKYINDKIIKNYDTPNLILEKQRLIKKLNRSNSFKNKGILYLLIVLVILSIFLIINYRTKKIYRKKFERLIDTDNKQENEFINKKKQDFTYLSEDITQKIKIGLEKFKSNNDYLNPHVSISTLAKKMDSNSKYLSLFINHYEQKKFTNYINDLRIEYAMEKIKNDKKFRKYTIKAIAYEIGFSNPVSFSQAFYKKTGIKPSYFIKQLESDLETKK
ncbi:AraC family transcriptional regulator [Aquimarina algiphila]|uniref:AraC family transcriptional regulator n=1 Tax=Aquimarina algiphila TaxID=2047982 RepID=UPI00232C7A42|nr:AraC family transcriptional regulator [Aquimarina algiphila]